MVFLELSFPFLTSSLLSISIHIICALYMCRIDACHDDSWQSDRLHTAQYNDHWTFHWTDFCHPYRNVYISVLVSPCRILVQITFCLCSYAHVRVQVIHASPIAMRGPRGLNVRDQFLFLPDPTIPTPLKLWFYNTRIGVRDTRFAHRSNVFSRLTQDESLAML